MKAASGTQWVKEFREDWCFIDLSLLSRSMDGYKCTHNLWFLFAQTQKIGMSLVAASEDDTSDQNGKPSTPAHLTSSTSTIITTRENLHLAITSVLRMLHLPRDQQFCLGLNRTAFFPVQFCIFEFEHIWACFVSFMCHFFTPVCSHKLSRAIDRPLFLVAWPVHNLLITLPASHQPFCFSFSTLSASSLVSRTYTHTLVWICLNIFCFFLCFMWPIC